MAEYPSKPHRAQSSAMSDTPSAVFDLLNDISSLVYTIVVGLRNNRLDRKTIQDLLLVYYSRTPSDGRLIDIARRDDRCVGSAEYLLHAHVELITWLVNHNFTVPVTSVKWYSWKSLLKKYRLPFLYHGMRSADIQSQLKSIEEKAGILLADMNTYNVGRFPKQSDFDSYNYI